MALAENGQCLVNKNSDQPASKGAFIFKVGMVARCGPPAVLDRDCCCALIAENAASDKVK
jgi:hypothetical protein